MIYDEGFYIYAAVSWDRTWVKVGISRDVKRRLLKVGPTHKRPFSLLRSWRSPHARAVERIIKHEWRHRAIEGTWEYFNASPRALVRKVSLEIRLCKAGKQPPALPGTKYAGLSAAAALPPELGALSGSSIRRILGPRRPNDPSAGGRGKKRKRK